MYGSRDVFTLLGEDGLRITTRLISNMLETGVWPNDLTEITMLALQKKLKLHNAPTIAQSAWSHIQQSSKPGYCKKGLKGKLMSYL